MPLPDLLSSALPVISGGGLTARFAPALGGRMVSLHHSGAGELLAPMDPEAVFDPQNWPRGGAYPLFPFHNRLPGACFVLGGQAVHLSGNPCVGGDVMHGPAHQKPWQVADLGPDRISLTLDWRADGDWPFDFRAEQHVRLGEGWLGLRLVLTNTGNVPMPGGMGWHPYFALDQHAVARLEGGVEWPLGNNGLPDDRPGLPVADGDMPMTTGWTRHFSDWRSASLATAPDWRLLLRADPVLRHVAVHRMQRYLCVEPVSHRAGALSLPEDQRAAAGLVLLASSETIGADIHLSLHRRQSANPQE